MSKKNKSAIVLLSGGLDSTTTLAIALEQGFKVFALSFKYGQRHAGEITAARNIARAFNVEDHVIATIDLRAFGGSALTSKLEVPKNRSLKEMDQGIPVTYVPARNTIFLSFALGWAEVLGATDIFIGVNALDYSGYPDCRPDFIRAFEKTANLATRLGVEGKKKFKIHAPLMKWSKGQIIKNGLKLGVDYSLTRTCYDPDSRGSACGSCDACLLRLKGFRENGITDPIRYKTKGARAPSPHAK